MLSTIRTRSTLIQSLRGVLCDLLDAYLSCRGQTDAKAPENNAEPRPVEQAGLGLLTAMPSSRATPPWTFPRQNRPHGPIKRRERPKPHPSRDRSRKPATPANISIYQVVDRAVKRPNNRLSHSRHETVSVARRPLTYPGRLDSERNRRFDGSCSARSRCPQSGSRGRRLAVHPTAARGL